MLYFFLRLFLNSLHTDRSVVSVKEKKKTKNKMYKMTVLIVKTKDNTTVTRSGELSSIMFASGNESQVDMAGERL